MIFLVVEQLQSEVVGGGVVGGGVDILRAFASEEAAARFAAAENTRRAGFAGWRRATVEVIGLSLSE